MILQNHVELSGLDPIYKGIHSPLKFIQKLPKSIWPYFPMFSNRDLSQTIASHIVPQIYLSKHILEVMPVQSSSSGSMSHVCTVSGHRASRRHRISGLHINWRSKVEGRKSLFGQIVISILQCSSISLRAIFHMWNSARLIAILSVASMLR